MSASICSILLVFVFCIAVDAFSVYPCVTGIRSKSSLLASLSHPCHQEASTSSRRRKHGVIALRASNDRIEEESTRIKDGLIGAAIGASVAVFLSFWSVTNAYPGNTPVQEQDTRDLVVQEAVVEASELAQMRNPEFALLQDVVDRVVESSAIPGVNVGKVTIAGIKGVLTGIGDPYASLLTGKELSRFKMQTDGRFGGVGIVLARPNDEARQAGRADDEIIVVDADDKPGSAYERGVRTGDRLVAVNGRNVAGMSLDKVKVLLAGEMGSEVKLRLQRAQYHGSINVDVVLKRGPLKRSSVQSNVIESGQGHVGYLKITNFDRSTPNEVRKALLTFTEQGRDLGGLVLDLRDNGGGLLQSCIDVATLFLDEGAGITTVSPHEGLPVLSYESRGGFVWGGGSKRPPIAVLINSRTASAAEVLAGAIQDSGVGVLVGPCSTQGKGLAQATVPLDLPGGEKGVYTLSVASYVTPKGRAIAERGLQPDIVIPNPSTGPFVSECTQQGIFFDWATEWLVKEKDPLRTLDEEKERALDDLVAFARKKAQEGRFTPGRGFKAKLRELEGELRRCGLPGAAASVSDIRSSLDQEYLKGSEGHEDDALQLMRLAVLSRTEGGVAMSGHRARSDRTVMYCVQSFLNGKWGSVYGLSSGVGEDVGVPGALQHLQGVVVGQKEADMLERVYPDIDVMIM